MLNEVDLYIKQFPENVQIQLSKLREIIIHAAPNATEIISYKMPAYKQYDCLVYFAAYKNHIGFYPTAGGIKAFEKEFNIVIKLISSHACFTHCSSRETGTDL